MTNTSTQTKKLRKLASQIRKFGYRAFDSDSDPEESSESWIFYLYVVVQQCGTGRRELNAILSCSIIWKIYFESWKTDRQLFSDNISFTDFKSKYRQQCRITSDDVLFTRYMMHQEVSKLYAEHGNKLLTLPILETSAAYGEVDKYHKKLNLFRLIVRSRRDDYGVSKTALLPAGPVIDYHLMRVFLRFLDLEILTDQFEAEELLRKQAFDLVLKLHNTYEFSFQQIDAFLWSLGRELCTYTRQSCELCPLAPQCSKSTSQEPRILTYAY